MGTIPSGSLDESGVQRQFLMYNRGGIVDGVADREQFSLPLCGKPPMSLVPGSAAGGSLSVGGDKAPRWWSTRHRVRHSWRLGAADVTRFHREIHLPAGFFEGIPRGQQVQFRHLKVVTDLDGMTTDRGPAAT